MTVIITRMAGGADARVIVTHMQGAAVGTGRVIITRMGGDTFGFAVDAGLPQTVDPFQWVMLNAVVATTGATADSWSVTQTSGTAVVLVGQGASRAFVAPATMLGDTLGFQFAASSGGGPPVSDTTSVVVRPHSGLWRYSGAQARLVAVEFRTTQRQAQPYLPTPLYPAPTLYPSTTLYPRS